MTRNAMAATDGGLRPLLDWLRALRHWLSARLSAALSGLPFWLCLAGA